MRLVLVTTDFPPAVGGTQTYAFELAARMHTEVDRFEVVAPRENGSDEVDEVLPFSVHRIQTGANFFPLRARQKLNRRFREGRVDAAFCVSWPAALACLLAGSKRYGITLFCAAHGRELLLNPWSHVPLISRFPGVSSLYPRLRDRVLQSVDTFFPVSRYTGTLLKDAGVAEGRIRVHGNGTDPRRFFPEDASDLRMQLGASSRPVVLSICRLVERKGIDTLIRSIIAVRRLFPDIFCLIGGDGPDRQRLEELVDRLNLDRHVRFCGRISYSELRSYYNVCDVFAMPAREQIPDVEGFGIVFLEASACGKPVIGTRTGGIPDAVIDQSTGILINPDDPDECAEALIQILSDAQLARRLGRSGVNHVARTANWNSVATALIEDMRPGLAER